MELTKIENLIEKYFEGNTSIEEEKILHVYFAQIYVPAHLQEYQAMFRYFSENKREISSQPIQVKTKKKAWEMSWLSIAAAIILLFTIYKVIPNDTISLKERVEAEQAFVETQKAFQLISQNLNKGNKAIAYLKDYEVVKNKIFKTNNN